MEFFLSMIWILKTVKEKVSYFLNWDDNSDLYKQLFNFSNIMRNAGLDEPRSGIKIAGRNINNHRYADDTTFMAEREEELKSLLMKVKEESEKADLLAQHSKN